jgi:hypothetical protein
MQKIRINTQQLINGLFQAHKTQQAFVTLTVQCSANEIRKSCPYCDDIVKISEISGRLVSKADAEGTYQRAVNRQLDREGKEQGFTSLPANYTWDEGPLVRYNNDGELGVPILNPTTHRVWIRKSTGQQLTPEELEQWKLKKSTKPETNRQGTDDRVTWVVPKVKNIFEIKAMGVEAVVG